MDPALEQATGEKCGVELHAHVSIQRTTLPPPRHCAHPSRVERGGIGSQERVLGRVIDGATEQAVIGASVFIEGSQSGAFTDFDGVFSFTTRDTGSRTLVVTSVGYERLETAIQVGENTDVGTISMNARTIGLDEVNIIASVAIDRKTPVAVSTLNAEFIENNLGSKELPEILNITPGVYATKQGGGAGDSRINIRGFNQRNVAVMISKRIKFW